MDWATRAACSCSKKPDDDAHRRIGEARRRCRDSSPELVNLYCCAVGDGQLARLSKSIKTRQWAAAAISSHTFICEGVTIEDDVFAGMRDVHHDRQPRATVNGRPQSEADWTVLSTLVRRGASIVSGAVICAA